MRPWRNIWDFSELVLDLVLGCGDIIILLINRGPQDDAFSILRSEHVATVPACRSNRPAQGLRAHREQSSPRGLSHSHLRRHNVHGSRTSGPQCLRRAGSPHRRSASFADAWAVGRLGGERLTVRRRWSVLPTLCAGGYRSTRCAAGDPESCRLCLEIGHSWPGRPQDVPAVELL